MSFKMLKRQDREYAPVDYLLDRFFLLHLVFLPSHPYSHPQAVCLKLQAVSFLTAFRQKTGPARFFLLIPLFTFPHFFLESD
jgi:hypothetical protein